MVSKPGMWWGAIAGLCLVALAPRAGLAQLDFSALAGASQPAVPDGPPLTVEALFSRPADGKPAELRVTAKIATGWHVYSLTQKPGGPITSKLTIEPGAGYKLAGEFKPLSPPDIHPEPAFDNLLVETHEKQVTWVAPLELTAGEDPAQLSIPGKLYYQVCNASSCMPPATIKFTARLGVGAAATEPAAADLGVYQSTTGHLTLRGHAEPRVAAPGGKVTVHLTAQPAAGWHVYPLAERDPQAISKPTLIAWSETSGLRLAGRSESGQIVEQDSPAAPGEKERFFAEAVTWSVQFDVPREVSPGEYKLAGMLGFQTCRDGACDVPQAVNFEVAVPVQFASVAGQRPLAFSPGKSYRQVAELAAKNTGETPTTSLAFDPQKLQTSDEGSQQSLLLMLGAAFLGGLILNIMPCVLPVIGLKILGFVEQSGQDRGQVFLLNVWYACGMLAVFMGLATMPVLYHLVWGTQFGWGQQFAYDSFNITLTAIVFVMALSFLGVWEIPIPGFVGSGKANDLAAKEGVAGAFAKGALTTVLATPCSGPFLGTALGFAFTQAPHVIYAIFGSIGLGMAAPYLLIGAFPRLIRFLPKPGAWMDTFKQIMGFVLLGTVVYLMTLVRWEAMVPTFLLLVGLWAGCWWIGRTPLFAELGVKLRAWGVGAAVAAAVGLVAFQWVGPVMADRFQLAVDKQIEQRVREAESGAAAAESLTQRKQRDDHLPWALYTPEKLRELTEAQQTVILDFTADWCQTCKALEKFVLNTAETRELVQANGVVPLIVDMTRFPPEEAALLQALSGGQSVPVLAIFPAGRPNEPIVLRDTYTKGKLLAKLREAGPSKRALDEQTVGMTGR